MNLPGTWTKSLALRHSSLDGGALDIHGGGYDLIAPPPGRLDAAHGEGEEDEEGGEAEAEVEPARGQEVEATPPAEVAPLDAILKEEADDAPRKVVERGGGGDGTGAAEDEGGHEVFPGPTREAPGGEEDGQGDDGADEEEEKEAGVETAGGEDAVGADEAPDDGGYIEWWA